MNIGILLHVNSTKQNRVAKLGMSVCSRIMRLTNNQTKSRKKSYHSHKGRERDDKHAVAIVRIVPQLGCVSQDSETFDSQRGKQSRGNPIQKVLRPIRRVRFTQSSLRQASIRKNKGPSLGKIQVKLPHPRSPYAVKFEDRSQEETVRQQRCAQSKAWNISKKNLQVQRERQDYILLALRGMGITGYINKGARRKRVCGGFRSEYAHGQQERP